MSRSNLHLSFLVWAGWLAVVLFLRTGPAAIAESARAGVLEVSGVILNSVHQISGDKHSSTAGDEVESNAQSPLVDKLQAENRELRMRLAELHRELDQFRASSAASVKTESERLIQVEAVEAAVIGLQGGPLDENRRLLIALGKRSGLTGEELVLSGQGLLIDQGTSCGLAADQLATVGRGLFGRTLKAGRWTTLVQPITDPNFRISVSVVRNSTLGTVQGPAGILAGTGTGCRVDEIPATEAVAVGDYVVTGDAISPAGRPIYCGRVTRAEVGSTDSHWSIDVAPLHDGVTPTRLTVLRGELNPSRMAQVVEP